MENQKNQYNEMMELKKAKEELKESKEKYKHIVQFAPTGIYEIDYKGPSFKSVNDAMCQITGYKKEELMKMSPFDLLSDESKKIFQKRIQKILNGEKIDENVDFQIITKDGHKIWANLNVKPIYKDGKLDGALVVAHDITERKKAEEALHESEERFRALSETAPIGVAVSRDGTFVYTNPTYERMLGYGPGELIGRKASDFYFYPSDRSKWCSVIKEEGVAHNFETKWKKKDGTPLWVSINVSPIIYGNKQGVIGTAQDITERKQVEESLKESEHLYKTLFENTKDAFQLVEPIYDKTGKVVNYRILEVNANYELQVGIKASDVEGRLVTEIDPNIEKNWIEIHGAVAKTGNSKRTEIYNNYSKRWYDLYLFPYGKGLVGALFRDITERKKAVNELEEAYNALSESEEKFREIFNQANDMITVVELGENGLPGRFLDVNDVAPKRLGYSKEEFSKMSTKDIIAPEYRFKMAENAKNLMKNKHARFEIVNVDKWGTKIPVEVSIHIFKLREKDVILAISRDIRERKQAEEQLKELINELERSNDELQQFAYVSSHDLQEPLRTIASFTQLLERRYKGRLDSDADEFMDYIVDAAKRMKEQIEGLLEFSRVGTKGVEFEPVDMNLVLNQTIQNLNLSIRETDAEITYEELPTVMGDSRQLQRVFQNLISNAIKFRKQDESPKIHITAEKDEDKNEYIFSIKDNGIGIEEQYFERIFTIFQQLHARKEYTGTGIGLAIVKRIIDRHRGHIWVKSEFGVGSTFYFTIPVEPVDIIEQKI